MLNKWIGIGNVTTDIELLETQSGKQYCKFTLAVNRYGGKTDFIPCVAWDRQAEAISKYCTKGSKMSVVGSLQVQSYKDSEGHSRTNFSVTVSEQDFLGKLSVNEDGEIVPHKKGMRVFDEDDGDLLPF